MKRFALFIIGLLLVSLMAASAYARDYDDVSVKVETVTLDFSQTGYSEYRAIIINHSTAKPHRVTIEISTGAGAVRRAVEVSPSSTMTIPIILPSGFSHMGDASVLIDGARQREKTQVDFSRTNSYVSRSYNSFYLLVSPNVDKSGLMNEAAVVEGFKNPAGQNDVAYLAYKTPMQEWSANWVAYSSFDGIAITAEELRDAPAAVRSALWSFTECGGSLIIVSPGAWEIPDQWRSRRINSVELEDEEDEETEDTGVAVAVEETGQAAAAAPKPMTVTLTGVAPSCYIGFGKLTILDADKVKSMPPTQWSAIKFGLRGSRPMEKNYRDIVDINKDFPVIEKIGIPVRGLFILMLVFVFVIGPVNLIWLARKRRKIWMLWTVPAIALITCLAVTGFALLGEGVNATSRAESFTILDESSHRASTIGWTAYYAPITPSDGLHFSYDTELRQVRPDAFYYNNRGGNNTVDLSNDQHLDSGWVTARVPAYFKFRKSETRRERLTIRNEGGGAISVVNGLGADVRHLWLADRDGKVYSASGIRAGAEAKLSPVTLKLAANEAALRGLFATNDWPGKMKDVPVNPQNFLAPGCYLASLDANPFVEAGLTNVKTRKGSALVYGVGASMASTGKDEK
ncbi:MAG TPA: hypothetical protein VFY40_12895 [Blastocatellia bacterium]|nr:hypothetical protein [Blastocatellia bacterium]